VHYGPRSLRVLAPHISNTLLPHRTSNNISRDQFKSGVKTWLFAQAYYILYYILTGGASGLETLFDRWIYLFGEPLALVGGYFGPC